MPSSHLRVTLALCFSLLVLLVVTAPGLAAIGPGPSSGLVPSIGSSPVGEAVVGAPLQAPDAAAVDAPPVDAADARSSADDATPLEILSAMADTPPDAKLSPALRASASNSADRTGSGSGAVGPTEAGAAAGSEQTELVVVMSAGPVDLGAFSDRVHSFIWPAGEHVSILRARPSDLRRIAAVDGVAQVSSGEVDLLRGRTLWAAPDVTASSEGAEVALGQAVEASRGETGADDDLPLLRSDPEDGELQGWWDIGDGHATREAWEMGYRGDGVQVAVLDTGVDYSHHDLQGTWPVLRDGRAYAGWPQVYDPTATYQFVISHTVGAETPPLRSALVGLIELYQEAEVTEEEVDGEIVRTACFRPMTGEIWGSGRSPAAEECDYLVPESQSGVVRFGHHPDMFLAGIRPVQEPAPHLNGDVGEYVGVLLVDAEEAGVYDTLYVDLDSDHDFTDEMPVTKESPLSYRDIDRVPDGVADLSGGLLYYMSDGELPVPGSYLWGVEDVIPPAGRVVGLFIDLGAHGTLCGSNVVSQGRLGAARGLLSFRDVPGGAPSELNPGMAPNAKLVGVGDVYSTDVVFSSAWRYVLFGHDPHSRVDDIQIASNSYGFSDVDNDGWDPDSRFIDYYVRHLGPTTTFMVSTGNGAPGYGTLAAPSPVTSMGIGSSTQFGAATGLSVTDTHQITFGDIIEFSNRGPTADGRAGTDVTANGMSGWGAIPINYLSANAGLIGAGVGLGQRANIPWGGTSRSSPLAAGGLALTYEAFRVHNDRWPTWQEARAVLKAGARFAAYDTFTMGAGVVDFADSVRIASGRAGVYAQPSEWTPGDYRGEKYPAFAKLMMPDESDSTATTLHNLSHEPITVTLSGESLRRIGAYTTTITTSLVAESPYNSAIPNYLLPIDRDRIPDGTELMIVDVILPIDQADVDRDNAPELENSFWLQLIQHTDYDGDGALWADADLNGSVGFELVDGAIDWSDSEIDRYEYNTLNDHSAETNNWTLSAHHPLERWQDGLYLGLWHREMSCADESDPSTCKRRTPLQPNTTMSVTVGFYGYEDWDWLELQDASVTVPASGTAKLSVTLSVPAGTPLGSYDGAVFVDYPRSEGDEPVETGGGWELPHQRIVVPVNVNVAADYDWQGTVTLGGGEAMARPGRLVNGAVRGVADRLWRPETGDWRMFFVDAARPPRWTSWLIRARWDDDIEHATDIDTTVWRQASDRYSDPLHPDNEANDWSDPSWYGPYTLGRLARSANAWVGAGTWNFETSSGENEDWLRAPSGDGLTEFTLHNVLFGGSRFEVPFEVEVGSIKVVPSELVVYEDRCARLSVNSQIEMEEFELRAVGLNRPQALEALTVTMDSPYTHTVTLDHDAAKFVVVLQGEAGLDLDLAVLYDEDADGVPDELLGESTSPTPNERVALGALQPPGDYLVVVRLLDAPEETAEFDLMLDIVTGEELEAEEVPSTLVADEDYDFEICVPTAPESEIELQGAVVFGPKAAPWFMSVPVTWLPEAPVYEITLPSLMNGEAEVEEEPEPEP